MQYTIAIFERLVRDVPPFLPETIEADAKQALEQLQYNANLTPDDLENTVIVFGKKFWPYRQAFEEWVDLYEGKLGEKFFLGRLTPTLKVRYRDFTLHGGTWLDVMSGAPALFFSADERQMLGVALVDTRTDIKAHARQKINSIDRERYEERVVEFANILDDIEKRLDTLRLMADDEQEHPELAAEIRAQVQAFEHGLCLLGPPHSFEAVDKAEEHFYGRKIEKKAFVHSQRLR